MTVQYLETTIVSARNTETPRYGMTVEGYTKRSGAPTSLMIRLEGEKRERRLMVWQFSNAGTCFVRIGGIPFIVRDHDLPTMTGEVVVGSEEWDAQETARLAALKPDGDPISKEARS